MSSKNVVIEKIKELRTKLNLSQQEVADGIGIGRSALSQIELGERKITVEELSRLSSFFEISLEELTQTKINQKKKVVVDENDKNYKLKQLILYILGKVSNREHFGETVLNRLLYFCDFDFYERNGEKTITGVDYVKLPFGPVPDGMKKILEEMKKEGLIQVITREYFNKTQNKIIALVDANNKIFEEESVDGGPKAKDIIDAVIDKLGGFNAYSLSYRSHGDMPYQATQKIGQIIEPGLVFYRLPAYIVNPNNLDN